MGRRFNVLPLTGNFGSSVASFFTFLRWLCALNLSLTLLVLGFLILPQVLSLDDNIAPFHYSKAPSLPAHAQILVGHGLEVPPAVRENGSAVSFLFDGKAGSSATVDCACRVHCDPALQLRVTSLSSP